MRKTFIAVTYRKSNIWMDWYCLVSKWGGRLRSLRMTGHNAITRGDNGTWRESLGLGASWRNDGFDDRHRRHPARRRWLERRSLGHYGPPLWNIYDDSHNNAGDDIIILCDRGVGWGGISERFLPLQSRNASAQRTATLQLLNIRTWISNLNSTPHPKMRRVTFKFLRNSLNMKSALCAQTRHPRIAHINLLIRSIIRLADEPSCEVEYIKKPFFSDRMHCAVRAFGGCRGLVPAGRRRCSRVRGGEPILYFVRPTSHQKFACS